MFARSILPMVLIPLALACTGCRLGHLSFRYYDDDYRPRRTRVTRVLAKHVCTHDCRDHYWDGRRVLLLEGHRHGRGCGHVWDGAHWVIVRKVKARRLHAGPVRVTKVAHVHGPSCGCVYNRLKRVWIKAAKGHVHRRGCGHVFIEGRWSLHY